MYRNQAFVYSIYSAIFLFVIVSASGLCLPAFALSQAGVKAFAANPLWILPVGCLVSLLAISFCFRAIKRKRTL